MVRTAWVTPPILGGEMNTDHRAKIGSVARCPPRLTKTRCPLTISPPILGGEIFALPKWEAKSVHGYGAFILCAHDACVAKDCEVNINSQ